MTIREDAEKSAKYRTDFEDEYTTEALEKRVERLEQMIKTLTESLVSVVGVVNTGSYEYNLRDVKTQLRTTKEFTLDEGES